MKLQNSHIIDIRKRSFQSHEAELVADFLMEAGVDPTRIIEVHDAKGRLARMEIHHQNPSEKKAVEKILRPLAAKLRLTSRVLRPSDWKDKWKEGIRPFQLTSRFDIVPVWAKSEGYKTRREVIYIDTSLAFGTGLHETTRFMAELIEASHDEIKSFLDIGTGTGILAIIAAKLGASKIVGVDIEEDAIKVAKDNFRLNGLKIPVLKTADVTRWKERQQFDFVAANLVTADLIRLKNRILQRVRPKSLLAVSGISLENLTVFRKSFLDKDVKLLKLKKGKKWAACLLRKS